MELNNKCDFIITDTNTNEVMFKGQLVTGDLRTTESINAMIDGLDYKGGISDGSHTFDELYYHRMILFSVICNQNKDKAWKSLLHHDGTMFDDYFIVGIETPKGQYSYHYHVDHWFKFDVPTLKFAPEWDGHEPKDVIRLLSL